MVLAGILYAYDPATRQLVQAGEAEQSMNEIQMHEERLAAAGQESELE